MKLFSEIYSTYYLITERILKKRRVTKSEILDIIKENGFSETVLFLEPKLLNEDGYGLLKKHDSVYESILKKEPHIPLTNLEKSWLCTVVNDPRSSLFLDPAQKAHLSELLGADSLYCDQFISHFDRYADGDDFEDDLYIRHFRTILSAIHSQTLVRISFETRKGNRITHLFLPTKLEYSSKNNKFRVFVNRYKNDRPIDMGIINISNITLAEKTDIRPDTAHLLSEIKKSVTVKILNERNAVNRFMMEFAELEKESVFDEETGECTVTMNYSEKTETEIIIRLLSFGPVACAVAPADFRMKVKQRVDKQYSLIQKQGAP